MVVSLIRASKSDQDFWSFAPEVPIAAFAECVQAASGDIALAGKVARTAVLEGIPPAQAVAKLR
jgi:hypothetical protein